VRVGGLPKSMKVGGVARYQRDKVDMVPSAATASGRFSSDRSAASIRRPLPYSEIPLSFTTLFCFWTYDSQIVGLVARKHLAPDGRPGVEIIVAPVYLGCQWNTRAHTGRARDPMTLHIQEGLERVCESDVVNHDGNVTGGADRIGQARLAQA
jgi:hypothetical protein